MPNAVGHLICAAPDVVAKCSGLPLAQVKSVQHTLLSKYNPHPVSNMLLLKETREKTLLFPFGKLSNASLTSPSYRH